ncbi:hypothetical protein [Staphylococcus sp. HMSC057C08]|uniref:hypothetical protein n=1 Tax=Staphylococcus sp. HMSC057C08 TaxID=1739501 RepID=UPI0015D67438|nr:hypothetical protein [Staphylococcus sp. HMSC057C08]
MSLNNMVDRDLYADFFEEEEAETEFCEDCDNHPFAYIEEDEADDRRADRNMEKEEQ